MIDPAALYGAITSANNIKSLISSALGAQRMAEANSVYAEVAELLGKLATANIAISQARLEQEAVLREKRELEEKVRALEAQKADFERYAMHEISTGVFVYAKREPVDAVEPMHYLCTCCRDQGKKSVLQREEAALKVFHRCPACGNTYLEKKIERERTGFEPPNSVGWMAR